MSLLERQLICVDPDHEAADLDLVFSKKDNSWYNRERVQNYYEDSV